MAEPARNIDPVYDPEDDDSWLSARERAAKRWGMNEGSDNEPASDNGKAASAPAGSARDRADRAWGMHPEQLNEAESAATPSTPAAAGGAEAAGLQQAASLFNPGDKDKNFLRGAITRRRLIGGGVTGGLVGLAFAIFSFTSGPLQFIHIAQLLQRFHFGNTEDTGDSRVFKLYKYARNRSAGTVENTRLSAVGRRIAAKIDPKMAEIGVSKKFDTGNLGTYKGTVIDPVKFAENAKNGGEFSGLNPEEFAQRFKETYNVDLNIQKDGTLISSSDNGFFAYFKNRQLNSLLSEEAGFSKISGSISTRIMGQRDGVTWHPIKAVDSRLVGSVDDKLAEWYKIIKERIKNGETTDINAQAKKDKSGQTTTDDAGAASGTDDALREAAEGLDDTGNVNLEKSTGPIKELAGSTGGKLAIGGTAAIGILCAVKGISESADQLKQAQVILPMIRMGMQAMSVGNQVMNGNDVSSEQLGFFSRELFDQSSGSWASARSIQAELGQQQTGPDIPDGANVKKISEGSMFSNILDAVPGLGTACDVSESVVGQAVNWAISVTTPIASTITFLITSSSAFQDGIKSLIGWLAGSPLPAVAFGANYGNYINYGAKLGANDSQLALGGTKLSGKQSLEWRNDRLNAEQQQFAQKSLFQKVFDVYSPDSLVAKAIDNSSTNVGTNVATLLGNVTNPLKSMASLFTVFSPKASAAATYDYGFQDIGYSLEDLNSPAYSDPYANADSAVTTLKIPCKDKNGKEIHPCGEDYIKLAQKCFGVTLSADGSKPIDSGLSASVDSLNKDYNGIEVAGIHCADSQPAWKQIRFYILDSKTAESLDCYYSGDSDSCQSVGFSGTANPAPTASSGFSFGKYAAMSHDDLVNLIINAPNWQPQNTYPTKDIKNGTAKDDLLRLIAALLEALPNERITASTIQTGHECRTTNGNISNHMGGLAIDIGNAGQTQASMNNMFGWLYQNAAELNINELIYDPVPNGMSTLSQGQPFTYNAATRQEHTTHIHVSVKGPKPTSCPVVKGAQ